MDYEDFERRHREREERRERQREERHRLREERRARRHRRHRHGEPKERVLHTRISEQLSEDIRKVAGELRVPVSNLVRNVLEEAFSAVETVSENVGALLEEVFEEAQDFRERQRRRREGGEDEPAAEAAASAQAGSAWARPGEGAEDFPEILGWQPLLLNREGRCAACGQILPRGRKAFVGVAAAGGPGDTMLCSRCLEEPGRDADPGR